MEPLEGNPSVGNSGLKVLCVGVVAREADVWWCFLFIRGELRGEQRVCLDPGGGGGGGGGGGLEEPSLGGGGLRPVL